MGHIELAKWADVVIIAPASANTIAKLCHGKADDLLSTVILATSASVMVAPSMNQQMYASLVMKDNLQLLQKRGVRIIDPGFGEQACGDVGEGRLAEPSEIALQASELFQNNALGGKRVLITVGGTVEAIDPVRFLSNHSSGKMGMALAYASIQASAETTLIIGSISVDVENRAKTIFVTSANEMHKAVMSNIHDQDLFISCAAVADYRPTKVNPNKIKKDSNKQTIELVANKDILSDVCQLKDKPICIGFAAETENFSVHKIGLISHIRFSFQLILIIWFFVFLIQNNYDTLKLWVKIGLVTLLLYYLSFLLFQQSLTGLVAFGASIFFYLILLVFQLKRVYKIIFSILAVAIISIPVLYVTQVINSFYNIEQVDENTIARQTELGNMYKHDFQNPMVENGNYVNLFVCEKEMREEWNKISEFKYDSIGINGYIVHSTLIRYLTSKGLKKDAGGILALNKQDIRNVESGVANVIYQSRKHSLYPRIYQTVWEYYVYSHTGDANYQSFSQRIEFAKAAISIIRENFWFGVGTGNWKEKFRETYENNGSNLNEKLYASSHNQYLNYLVKFGIVGFLLIMFFLIYPVIKTRSYKDSLFLIFLVFMFFANFADSNFESHMGSSFFLFFYCLFLIKSKSNYLKIEQ